MPPSAPPAEIVAQAEARAEARAARDWATADGLKAEIERAGWRVVDHGIAWELHPAHPPDIVADGHTVHGSAETVPSRLAEPPATAASYVVIAAAGATPADTTLAALARVRGPDTQVLVVTDGATAVAGPADEIVRMVEPLGPADALAAAVRRCTGSIIVVLEAGAEPLADVAAPLQDVLADPEVAIAGSDGLRSADLHRYERTVAGDATTLGSGCYAFRRSDAIDLELLDRRLRLHGSVTAWLGLALRDRGPDRHPRRAVAIDLPLRVPRLDEGGLGVARHDPGDRRDRRDRRDRYRLAAAFSGRMWLAAESPPRGHVVGDGAERDDHDDEPGQRDDAAPA